MGRLSSAATAATKIPYWLGKRAVGDAAITAKAMSRIGVRGGGIVGRHPGVAIGIAGFAGMMAADPWQGADAAINEALLGDPDADRKLWTASIASQFINPPPSARPPFYAPNQFGQPTGDIVFGLWNERLR